MDRQKGRMPRYITPRGTLGIMLLRIKIPIAKGGVIPPRLIAAVINIPNQTISMPRVRAMGARTGIVSRTIMGASQMKPHMR